MDILTNILFIYVAFAVIMYVFQDKFLYFPAKDRLDPVAFGLKDFQPVQTSTSDNIPLAMWWKAPLTGYPTIIYFHGNAGHLGDRAYKFAAMAKAGFGVLALSYRGYGASGGTPSEAGLYEDARAAVAFAKEHLAILPESIILYGESLGSGVAVHTAAVQPVAMVVLEAPYTSVMQRAKERFPFLPVGIMLRSEFDSIGKIQMIGAPLLIFHGEQDAIIPIEHGRAVLDAANDPKKGLFYPEYDHTNFDADMLSSEMMAYAKEQGIAK